MVRNKWKLMEEYGRGKHIHSGPVKPLTCDPGKTISKRNPKPMQLLKVGMKEQAEDDASLQGKPDSLIVWDRIPDIADNGRFNSVQSSECVTLILPTWTSVVVKALSDKEDR